MLDEAQIQVHKDGPAATGAEVGESLVSSFSPFAPAVQTTACLELADIARDKGLSNIHTRLFTADAVLWSNFVFFV